MRLKAFWLTWLLILCACSVIATPAEPGAQPLQEVPPSPYPDTPAPAVLDAPVVAAPALQSLEMLNQLDGWGVTATQIVRTSDGGSTWYDVTPPGLDETGYTVSTGFLDAEHAWVQMPDMNRFPDAGTLYRSKDGGLTWTFNTVQFGSGRLAFLNETDGWVLADRGVGAGSNAVAVLTTRDGGVTWERVFTNDPNHPTAGESLPLSGLKSSLVPITMETAWVGGLIYAPATVYLYRTNDGGRTWAQVDLELPDDAAESEVAVGEMKFLTERDGYLALRLTGPTYRTAIYVTHNAGETWSLLPTLLPGTGTTEFLSEQELVFYNGQQFYTSRDGGQTWRAVEPDVVFGDFFASMGFASAATGWVAASDPSDPDHRTLYKTTDGGATWFPLIP